MIDNQSIWFSAVLDGVEHKAITKIRESQTTK